MKKKLNEEQQLLKEAIRTQVNLCAIVLILQDLGRDELLPTVLEMMFEHLQAIIDEYCVEGKED